MLIEFRVENHRSIRDEQVLTMEAGRVGSDSDPRPRHVDGYAESLLPVAALYGGNASGKSNVLAALAFMRDAVLESHRSWSPDQGVPRDPFAWGEKRADPSLFEATVLIAGIRYQYGFTATDENFVEEWLYAWPNGKKQIWFERDDVAIFKFGEHLKGENKLIEDVTRKNALFLSAAVQLKHEQLLPIYLWFRQLGTVNMDWRHRPFFVAAQPPPEWLLTHLLNEERTPVLPGMSENDSLLASFRSLLRASDTGIVDFRVEEPPDSDESGTSPDRRPRARRRNQIFLKHICASEAWLPLTEESKGTQTLFRMALPILMAVRNGHTILVDELEASLHPTLAQQIVRQFNNPATNPRNAQLIFSTHDTNLLGTILGEPALRRDQVWLTEKNNEGATVLYPLTDYKPRSAENLERGYLQGRYGAIPFLENFTLGQS
jgi:AAA15 family ATPase/GTPase